MSDTTEDLPDPKATPIELTESLVDSFKETQMAIWDCIGPMGIWFGLHSEFIDLWMKDNVFYEWGGDNDSEVVFKPSKLPIIELDTSKRAEINQKISQVKIEIKSFKKNLQQPLKSWLFSFSNQGLLINWEERLVKYEKSLTDTDTYYDKYKEIDKVFISFSNPRLVQALEPSKVTIENVGKPRNGTMQTNVVDYYRGESPEDFEHEREIRSLVAESSSNVVSIQNEVSVEATVGVNQKITYGGEIWGAGGETDINLSLTAGYGFTHLSEMSKEVSRENEVVDKLTKPGRYTLTRKSAITDQKITREGFGVIDFKIKIGIIANGLEVKKFYNSLGESDVEGGVIIFECDSIQEFLDALKGLKADYAVFRKFLTSRKDKYPLNNPTVKRGMKRLADGTTRRAILKQVIRVENVRAGESSISRTD